MTSFAWIGLNDFTIHTMRNIELENSKNKSVHLKSF